MKNRIHIASTAIICIAIVGCMKTDSTLFNTGDFAIYASRENLYQTKTELQSDNSIVWSPADEISIFFDNGSGGGYKFASNNDWNTDKVVFKPMEQVNESAPNTYWAVYPYDENNSCDGNSVTTVLPFIQTARTGSFNDDLFISVAKSTSNYMTFFNVCGGIKFSVKEDNIREVIIMNNDGGWLSGTLKIVMNAKGLPEIESISDGSPILRILAPFGETFSVDENYYAVIPPVALSEGVTVRYLTTEGKEAASVIESPTTIERSTFTNLPFIGRTTGYDYSPFITFVSEGESAVGLFSDDSNLQYSFDGLTWTQFSSSDIYMTKHFPSFFLRGYDATIKKITMEGDNIGCYGSVMKLLDYTCNIDFVPDERFSFLFSNCKQLIHAPELPAEKLAERCYNGMFSGCTSLTTAPILPAETLAKACYGSMFYGCTSLITAPDLPAKSLAVACYISMFSGCTSLATAPELPAEKLAEACYDVMFYGCTSLATAPDLPAKSLAETCYNGMFYGCTSLITAPALPAKTLTNYCYAGMFSGCTSLTTAPILPAETLAKACYGSMFYGCTSLITAPDLPAKSLAETCYSYMFEGCTSLITAPELPSETLAKACYNNMFAGCTSLITAPELPAKSLAENCYSYMFEGCTRLGYIKALFVKNDSQNALSNWLEGVSPSGTFVKNVAATWDNCEAGIPEGWTVEYATE